jgi:hypothetical protein
VFVTSKPFENRRSTFACSEWYSVFTGHPRRHFSGAAEGVEERAPGVVGAEHHARIHVQRGDDVVSAVADVGHFGRPPAGQLALIRHVPGMQRAFMQVRRDVEICLRAQRRVPASITPLGGMFSTTGRGKPFLIDPGRAQTYSAD